MWHKEEAIQPLWRTRAIYESADVFIDFHTYTVTKA